MPYLRREYIFALFATDYLNLELGGEIFSRATANTKTLREIDADIATTVQAATTEDVRQFQSTSALILTYVLVPTRNAQLRHTFQMTLATDGDLTYVLTNYRQLGIDSVIVGLNDRLCRRAELKEVNTDELIQRGHFVERVSCQGINFCSLLLVNLSLVSTS